MGLGDADLLDDGGGGGCKMAAATVPCSICLEVVMDTGDRSWAKLLCGHQFHLDCIGSAFNAKGAMQCPNCRKIEKGQWLYANGCRPVSEFSMEDWAHDDDLYDFNYAEMESPIRLKDTDLVETSFGLHWCPYSGSISLPSSLDEGEFSSSASHPCPYVAYFGPIQPSSSASHGSISDGSSFNNHWSSPSVPSEAPHSYAFPSMESHYRTWDHSSPFATNIRIGGAEQASVPSVTQRTTRNSSDNPRPGIQSFIVGHSSPGRAPSSVPSSGRPPLVVNAVRPRDHVSSLQGHFQQSNSSPAGRTPVISHGQINNILGVRGYWTQVAPIASSSDQSSGFYVFSSGSSGRSFPELEAYRDRIHGWEQDYRHSYLPSQVDRDIWGAYHPPPATGSDVGVRSNSSRLRHGSERLPSQYRQ